MLPKQVSCQQTGREVVDQTFVRQVLGGGDALGLRVMPVPAPGAEPGR
jgi:hypothetical protein